MADSLKTVWGLPALPPSGLRVIPLGGLGEIGRNMTVFEFQGKMLIVDCGVLFPEDHQPGIDLVLPDFSYLDGRSGDIVGTFLTHGHEDHIGGVPYLMRKGYGGPIFGSRLTLGFVRAKLNGRQRAPLTEVREGDTIEIGPFMCSFIAVNHSIPDALAVAITTEAGVVVHTGDFKADPLPIDGRLTDMGTFHDLGREGVALLLSDSTNAEVPGFIGSERDIGPILAQVIQDAPGRVFVACTSSHIHRIQHVLDAAARSRRQLKLVGRSMQRNFRVAQELGYLNIPDGILSGSSKTTTQEHGQLIVLCTGSQGEPDAALSRMANGRHPEFELRAGDLAVFASSLIPGNENAVYSVINQLAYMGVETITKDDARVHVSGHAAAGELTQLLNAVRPANFLPVHGEGRHLRAHGRLAERSGVPKDRIFVARDGAVLDLVDGVVSVTGNVPAGFTYVDGVGVGDVGEESLRDRRILRDDGFISAVLVVDRVTGEVLAGPEIAARGFIDGIEHLEDIRAKLAEDLRQATAAGRMDVDEIRRLVRRTIGAWVDKQYRRRPMLLVYALEA